MTLIFFFDLPGDSRSNSVAIWTVNSGSKFEEETWG